LEGNPMTGKQLFPIGMWTVQETCDLIQGHVELSESPDQPSPL